MGALEERFATLEAQRLEREAAAQAEAEKREAALEAKFAEISADIDAKAKAAEEAAVQHAAEVEVQLLEALTEQEANWTKRADFGDSISTAQQSLLDQVLAVLARDTAAEVKAMRDARAAIAAVEA